MNIDNLQIDKDSEQEKTIRELLARVAQAIKSGDVDLIEIALMNKRKQFVSS
jgi:hypothetical protein